jgi:hypothetical protein
MPKTSVAVMVAQIANALPGALNGEFQQSFNTVGSQLTWITAAFMIPVVVFELTFGLPGAPGSATHELRRAGEGPGDATGDQRHVLAASGVGCVWGFLLRAGCRRNRRTRSR